MKRYSPDRPVPADDVRALLGVLLSDQNATKGILTTTSTFAPMIPSDPFIKPHIPFRLELVDGRELNKRLWDLAGLAGADGSDEASERADSAGPLQPIAPRE